LKRLLSDIIKIWAEKAKKMGLSENLKSDGIPNFYKLSKPVDQGGLGIDRKTLSKLWEKKRY
jgi:hypothetical protein